MATFQQVLVRPRRRSHAITGVVRSPAEKAPRPSLKRAAAMLVLAAFFAFPIVFMFVASFKPDGQLLRDVSSIRAFVPYGDLSLDNYRGVFARVPAARFIFNSVLISTVTVGLGLFVNSLAGFALARLRFRGAKVILPALIATLIVPFETIAIPLLLVVSKLPWLTLEGGRVALTWGWLNSYHVQILPFVANAFAVFLFAQSFKSIPKDLDEAARVDGATWFQIYRRIIVPLSGPAFATVAILTFLPIWNAYLWPLMVTQSSEIRPVMVGLQYFFQLNVAWGEIMAYLSMITIPVLVVFLAFQRAFIESVASAGVKG
jgi:multiple sugar transport system permease protein